MKVSNKTIATLVVVLLLFTAIGTFNVLSRPKVAVNAFAAGDVTASIALDTSITLPNNTVAFGNITQGTTDNTLNFDPWPFTVQNDGSVKLNLTISATDLWDTSAAPSSDYRFFANITGEGAPGYCFDGNATSSNITLANMPDSTGGLLGLLESNNGCDSAEIEIEITAPADEPAGNKESTITVTASQG